MRKVYNRYMNCGRGPSINVKLHPPLFVKGKRRITVVAVRDIARGEELLWDYGASLQRNLLPWMKVNNAKENAEKHTVNDVHWMHAYL